MMQLKNCVITSFMKLILLYLFYLILHWCIYLFSLSSPSFSYFKSYLYTVESSDYESVNYHQCTLFSVPYNDNCRVNAQSVFVDTSKYGKIPSNSWLGTKVMLYIFIICFVLKQVQLEYRTITY